jgi:hypothetical protein
MTPASNKTFLLEARFRSVRRWWLAGLTTMFTVMPTIAAPAGPPAVTDVGAELHARALGETYLTARGTAICVQSTAGSWHLWYVAHPAELAPAARGCPAPRGAEDIAPTVQFGPTAQYAGLLRPATFSGATSVVMNTGGVGAHCAPLFSSYYTVTMRDGRSEAFYIIVRLSKPRKISYACSDGDGRTKPFSVDFADVGPLESIDAGDGTSILYALDLNAARPVLLRVRAVPSLPWESGHSVFLIPHRVLGPKLAAAGDDQRSRYAALLAIIGPNSR